MKKASLCAAVVILGCGLAMGQAEETVLYNFGLGNDGSDPHGALTFDSKGNIYGTTPLGGAYGGGTVFELSPSDRGWSETVLYNFCPDGYPCPDGYTPESGVILDAKGNLYGTTPTGGGLCGNQTTCGTVFELSPPSLPGGSWTETVLSIECKPIGGLIWDKLGNLYGTLVACDQGSDQGSVFELSPPSVQGGSWTTTALYSFCAAGPPCLDGADPVGGVIFDDGGNLYGVTTLGGRQNDGLAYEISPTTGGGAWTERILAEATNQSGIGPDGGLVFDHAGNLYGTLSSNSNYIGAVFRLTHMQGGSWVGSYLQLTVGTDPVGGLLVEDGIVYGTANSGGTEGGGTVFDITGRTQTALYNFCSLPNCADGAYPAGPLTLHNRHFYGVTGFGGKAPEGGVAYEITP